MTSEEIAAWVQAFGSIGAIVAVFAVARQQFVQSTHQFNLDRYVRVLRQRIAIRHQMHQLQDDVHLLMDRSRQIEQGARDRARDRVARINLLSHETAGGSDLSLPEIQTVIQVQGLIASITGTDSRDEMQAVAQRAQENSSAIEAATAVFDNSYGISLKNGPPMPPAWWKLW